MAARVPRALEASAAVPARMTAGLRAAVFVVCALLWASGILWLVLHLGFEPRNEFGALPHPWEAPLMRVHGVVAVVGVFLLGWLGAGHVLERWRRARKRTSGWVLMASAVLLVLSGYALYYTVGAPHAAAAWLHEWLGAAALIVALAHWLRIRSP